MRPNTPAIVTLLDLWLQRGCDRAPSETLKRKILNVNAAAASTLVLVALIHLVYIAIGHAGLIKAGWALTPFYPLLVIVPWLNHRGHDTLARWLLPSGIVALVVLNVWTASGTWLGAHYYFISVLIVVPVLFPLAQWPAPAAFFAVNTALFLYGEYIGVPPDARVLSIDPHTTYGLRALHIGTALMIALAVTLMGDWMASRNEHELESRSNVDALTGLANRRRMRQRLGEFIATSKRTGHHGAVLFLDLDHFKPLNDAHGHAFGDLLLREAAQRMRAGLREVDVVARVGGDEFVVLLTRLGQDPTTARHHARQVADKLRITLARPYELSLVLQDGGSRHVVHHCTASVGVCVFQGGDHDADVLLNLADAAMYRAKDQGRDTICFQDATPSEKGSS